MAPFSDVTEVETALDNLAQDPAGARVVQLPREPGRRDSRYAHLFSGEVHAVAVPSEPGTSAHTVEPSLAEEATSTLTERVSALEQQLRDLRAELAAVRLSLSSQEGS
jgi:uncharacterized protein YceH (UPF0502 family)